MQQREVRTRVTNSTVQLQRKIKTPDHREYTVVNISRGGLCFESQDAYELNEVVQANVVINKQTKHLASGRICYRTKTADKHATRYGLSFLDHFIDADLVRRRNKGL
ncbi:MAG TPA: hypothetical protein ENJ08_10350 [Gammaproteobacteria bacterium]|nr:hypothetical protein [Gammaproteobacteria bacterium]